MGGEPLTKDQLRKYVSDGDKWIKTLGRLNPEFSNSYDDALLIGKNLNEKDVQNLYFGQLEHTTYIDITEWFIEFVELCYKVADKNIKNDFDILSVQRNGLSLSHFIKPERIPQAEGALCFDEFSQKYQKVKKQLGDLGYIQ